MSLTETKGEERGKSRKIWGLIFWPAEFQVPWYIPVGLSTVQLEFQSGKELSTGERDLAALANGRLKPSGWVRATQGSPEWRDKGRGGVSGKAGWGGESGEQQQPWGIWALSVCWVCSEHSVGISLPNPQTPPATGCILRMRNQRPREGICIELVSHFQWWISGSLLKLMWLN